MFPYLAIHHIVGTDPEGKGIQRFPGLIAKQEVYARSIAAFRICVINRLDNKGSIFHIHETAVAGEVDNISSLLIEMQVLIKVVYKFPTKHLGALIVPDAIFVDPDVARGCAFLVLQVLLA